MQQNGPSPARYRATSACRAAPANSTANEDLMAAVPGPGCVLHGCGVPD